MPGPASPGLPLSASGGLPGNAAHAAGVLNGLNEMDCDGLAEVAAELALGVLTGRERAQGIKLTAWARERGGHGWGGAAPGYGQGRGKGPRGAT